jgi:hypothetical protein
MKVGYPPPNLDPFDVGCFDGERANSSSHVSPIFM